MADTAISISEQAAAAHTRRFNTRWLLYTILILIAIIALIPFAWMLLTSINDLGDVISLKVWPWPPLGNAAPQWKNYPDAIALIGTDPDTGMPMFFRQLLNTAFVTACVIIGVTVTSVMAAYAFAQLNFPGKSALFILVLATLMIPDDLTLIPRTVMMYKNYLNWYNSFAALTVPFLASAFGIFLIRQFFLQIPRDLFDAARIDGAGHMRYLLKVMIPLTRPAILTVALFNFIWTWNEFKWAQLVTRDNNMRMISVSLQVFLQGEGGTSTHLAMAVATMVVAPILVVFFFTQKYFTEGITTTGIKG
ncbi:MAG: carbohydrate ABC transporter permease [Chloroflexi bacterium]|nr:carbohydrate ABC transporter permease [Chloroflexota bacterium]MCL5275988.1 carbohydrate ABC transporter permease [Chloroflexota bacterium]